MAERRCLIDSRSRFTSRHRLRDVHRGEAWESCCCWAGRRVHHRHTSLRPHSGPVALGWNALGRYSIANVGAPDGHAYVVIFDSTGTLRWYRDFGPQFTSDARQQANGDITVFLGPSNGYQQAQGAFVEVRPSGDSVRAITALGSAYTDPHELITTYDRQNGLVAAYLFGYA